MSKERRRYLKNKRRVLKIYGISPKNHSYDIHHIVFRSDAANRNSPLYGFDVDQLSNLCPLLRKEHQRLHKLIERIENGDKRN